MLARETLGNSHYFGMGIGKLKGAKRARLVKSTVSLLITKQVQFHILQTGHLAVVLPFRVCNIRLDAAVTSSAVLSLRHVPLLSLFPYPLIATKFHSFLGNVYQK